jgi:hypothetical protein
MTAVSGHAGGRLGKTSGDHAHLPKSGDLLVVKPGRAFDSVGAGRYAKENPTDPHRKRDFASGVPEIGASQGGMPT